MNYLWVSHTLLKHNRKTGKWDMKISLAWNKPFVKMSFDSEAEGNKFVAARMKEMYSQAEKDRRKVLT